MTGLYKRGHIAHSWSRCLTDVILFLGALFVGLSTASSQERGTLETSAVRTSQSTQSSEPQADRKTSPSTQAEVESDKAAKEQKKKTHRGSIVAAPLPIVSPALGAGIIPVLGYIFPLSEKDKISRPSAVGAGGLITDNGTRGFGVGGQLFMKENRYQVQGGFADGHLNYNLYGIGITAGNTGHKLPIAQSGRVFFGEAMRKVGWDTFIGPRLWIGNSVVTIRESNGETPAIPPDVGLH